MKFALLGLGTVGRGVLSQYREECSKDFDLVGVYDRSWRKKKEILAGIPTFDGDFSRMLTETQPDVIIEATGAVDEAYKWISTALNKRVHVITASKALLAKHGNELFSLSQKQQCFLLFEAAVGGALPLIKNFQHFAEGEKFSAIYGILNSTSNFIISRMTDGLSFQEALTLAQDRGFAEADPSADILGHDAAQKIALLASLVFRRKIDLAQVQREGIKNIEPLDLQIAAKLGYVLRPLVFAKKIQNSKIVSGVQNTLVNKDHTLAKVRDSLNAVWVQAKYAKNIFIMGEGAGSLPTASAIVSDLTFLAKTQKIRVQNRLEETQDTYANSNKSYIENTFYIRVSSTSIPRQINQEKILTLKDTLVQKHKISIKEIKEMPDNQSLILIIQNCDDEETLRATISDLKENFVDCKTIVFPILTQDMI